MSLGHTILTTSGIVLGKRGVGEANTLVALFTRDRGLLYAKAQSSRLSRSKLRYFLEPLTVARFSLVRGKHEWKIVNGHRCEEDRTQFAESSRYARHAIGKILQLLTRLIHGEEPSPVLFDQVAEGISLLLSARTREEVDGIESVLVLRTLHHLGYLPKTPELAPFIGDSALSMELAAQAATSRSALIRSINESLSATGL